MNENEVKICDVCATPIPPGDPKDQCPHCMMRLLDEVHDSASRKDRDNPLSSNLRWAEEGLTQTPFRDWVFLGRGGMGVVYRAYDPLLERQVALKILSPIQIGNIERTEQLLVEARHLARTRHPNVVAIHEIRDIETPNGTSFLIVMEYIDGVDLATTIQRQGRLPVGQVHDLALQICDGLTAAHREGVLHCDIKPSNILIAANGSAKLIDFGLAVRLGDSLSATDRLAGTPLYMPPERLAGGPPEVKGDIYALGVVFRELLTGVPYHDSRRVALLPFGQARAWLKIIDRALGPLDQRYESVEALRQDIAKAGQINRRRMAIATLSLATLIAIPLLDFQDSRAWDADWYEKLRNDNPNQKEWNIVESVVDSNGGLRVELNDHPNLKNIRALRGAPIVEVDLSGTGVTDLSPIARPGVTGIELQNCSHLSKIDPLKTARDLTHLNLKEVKLRSISPARNLPLNEISFEWNPKWPAKVLDRFQANSINIGFDAEAVRILDELVALDNSVTRRIVTIAIKDSQFSDLAPLAMLENLQHIYLADTSVSNLTPLANLNLVDIDIRNTKVESLRPIEQSQMSSITVKGAPIDDFEPIMTLSELRSLEISTDQVEAAYDAIRRHVALESISVGAMDDESETMNKELFLTRFDPSRSP